jgi:hypothetical protein
MIYLCERLTFDKLFRVSDPKRVYRSFTTRGPPLEIDSYQDVVYYIFNFKASPSTTGLRHRGYIKFFKPEHKSARNVPLQHLECLVDCECPDFRYRWAWANKQRGSSRVGSNSLNQAWNKAPRKTNPRGLPGLCKHILAARAFIYGLLSSFPGDEPDTAEKLNQLTRHAAKRWTDYESAQAHAKEVEKKLLQIRKLRNLGLALPGPVVPPDKSPPLAVPPGERGRQLPSAPELVKGFLEPEEPEEPEEEPEKPDRGRQLPSPIPPPPSTPAQKTKPVIGGRRVPTELPVKGMLPSPFHIGAWESLKNENHQNQIFEHVVNSTENSVMTPTLNEAIRLVREMENDELALQRPGGDEFGDASGGAGGLDDLGALDSPMEPPVSDSAIGADTEGETAIGLLRQMTDLLTQIATAVAPEAMTAGPEDGEGMPGEGGGEGMPGGMPGEGDMPGEPPEDLEGGGPEGAPGEGAPEGGDPAEEEAPEKEGGEEEGETRPKPKHKKPPGEDE